MWHGPLRMSSCDGSKFWICLLMSHLFLIPAILTLASFFVASLIPCGYLVAWVVAIVIARSTSQVIISTWSITFGRPCGSLFLAALLLFYCVLARGAFLRLTATYHYITPIVFCLLRCWIRGFSLAHFFLAVAASCASVGCTGIPLKLLFLNLQVLPCHG
jgi:hypothetical protein